MMSKKNVVLLGLILWLWVGMFPQAHAQDEEQFIFVDEVGGLSEDEIRAAAQPLIDRGAVVAVYLVQAGEQAAFDRYLRSQDLLRGENFYDPLVGIFVSLDDRYSEIAYGYAWQDPLNRRAETIRNDMSGNLRDGAYDLAFAQALQALNIALSDYTYTPVDDPNAAYTTITEPAAASPAQSTSQSASGGDNGIFSGLCIAAMLGMGFIANLLGLGGRTGTSSSRPRYRSSWTSGRSSSSFRGGGRRGGKW